MEEMLRELNIEVSGCEYLLRRNHNSTAILIGCNKVWVMIWEEDIDSVLEAIEYCRIYCDSGRTVDAKRFNGPYTVISSGSTISIKDIDTELEVPFTAMDEIVDAIKILMGDVKWKKT